MRVSEEWSGSGSCAGRSPGTRAHREAVGDDPHELPLAPEVLEEHDELELEEDDRIDGRPAALGVQRLHQIPHEREVERRFEAAVEVVFWDEILQGEVVG